MRRWVLCTSVWPKGAPADRAHERCPDRTADCACAKVASTERLYDADGRLQVSFAFEQAVEECIEVMRRPFSADTPSKMRAQWSRHRGPECWTRRVTSCGQHWGPVLTATRPVPLALARLSSRAARHWDGELPLYLPRSCCGDQAAREGANSKSGVIGHFLPYPRRKLYVLVRAP
jgi:hypothetical protein